MDLVRLQERAAAGDAEARAELIRTFYPRVREMVHRELDRDFRQKHRWILPLFSTGDIVQEVFESVVTGLDRFEVEGEDAFVRFVSTLVKHRLVDAIRHHEAARRDARRRQEDELGVPAAVGVAAKDPTPSLAASLGEQLRAFREALDTFPERQRALLELRLVEEQPWATVAEQLGYPSPDAARKAFHETQARLLLRLRRRGVQGPGGESRD
jgi:RNA polymerase sigma factor (sigma-70 family)